MNLIDYGNRNPVVATVNTTLGEAARLMREHHVGSLVIVRSRADERYPVGILTDRDIVVATVA